MAAIADYVVSKPRLIMAEENRKPTAQARTGAANSRRARIPENAKRFRAATLLGDNMKIDDAIDLLTELFGECDE